MTSPNFDHVMGAFFGDSPKPSRANNPAEKGVQIRGRKLDGNQYVRAADVAAYLALNPQHGVPGLARAMDRHSKGDAS